MTIPAGIDNGQSIRIREKGEPGVNGGPRGDLLVEVQVERHPIFQRQDMNIYSTAPVNLCTGSTGRTDPYHNCRRRYGIRYQTWNTDGYQDPS